MFANFLSSFGLAVVVSLQGVFRRGAFDFTFFSVEVFFADDFGVEAERRFFALELQADPRFGGQVRRQFSHIVELLRAHPRD